MKINVTWDNEEKTVVRYDYGKGWTWNDFWAASETSNQMLATVDHTVDFLTSFVDGTPPSLGAFGQFKRAQDTFPENGGVVIIVGGGALISGLVTTFSKVYRKFSDNLLVAKTVDEARVILAERRQGNE